MEHCLFRRYPLAGAVHNLSEALLAQRVFNGGDDLRHAQNGCDIIFSKKEGHGTDKFLESRA